MTETLLDLHLWKALEELRNTSQMVLVALENDDIDLVQRLANEADEWLALLRPEIERRAAEAPLTEADQAFTEVVHELQTINGRILERIDEKKKESAQRLGDLRRHRLKLVHYRASQAAEASRLDEEG